MDERQSDLDSFRQQWREEVFARLNSRTSENGAAQVTSSRPGKARKQHMKTIPPSNITFDTSKIDENQDRREFHDLRDGEDILRLKNESTRLKAYEDQEPCSALEHYEKAVKKEDEGRLGDSVNLYRKAFRLDSRVHEIYKHKHFPPNASSSQFSDQNGSYDSISASATQPENSPMSISELIEAFSVMSIPPVLPESRLSYSPPCPIASIPEEILREIYGALALSDVAAFSRLAQVCKRFAYLVMTEDSVWKKIVLDSEYGMAGMHFSYACDLSGLPLLGTATPLKPPSIGSSPMLDMTPSIYATYRAQFRHRPRIRFNGCYISTVNYTRPGAASPSQLTWNSPIHIVTYYRYLRFFNDGTVISLQTPTEPADVVHHLLKENVHKHHTGAFPSAVMKDALHGRWRLSGAVSPAILNSTDMIDLGKGPGEYVREHLESEDEGVLYVETEGVVPKYMWKMEFGIGSAGRRDGTRNNKLTWRGFWSYNRLADDWGEFRLKNDRAFYWSRVKSYGTI